MLIALPAFRSVRHRFPVAQITLLTNLPVSGRASPAHAVLEGTGLVDRYLSYPLGLRDPRQILKLMAELQAGQYDAVINLAAWRNRICWLRDRIFFWAAGCGRQIGFALGELPPRIEADGVEREAQRLLRRVEARPRPIKNEDFALALTKRELEQAANVLESKGVRPPFIAFSIGAKVPAKDWGEERWTDLLRKLCERVSLDVGLVALGVAEESFRADGHLRVWKGRVANLCGLTTPRESAAILAHAQCFLGHDSGPMHLAAAVDTPCIVMFAARTWPKQWFPLGERHTILYREVPCAGCQLDVCTKRKKVCLTSITIDDAASAVDHYIQPGNLVTHWRGGGGASPQRVE